VVHTSGCGVVEVDTLLPGAVYLVEEKTPENSYELFSASVSEGKPGLVITRDYPPDIRRNYSLPDCLIQWLTHLVGENHINPTSLGLLLSRVANFINRNSQAMVLLDGMEYLISQNGYDRILHFIHQVRDMIITGEGTMIMPLDIRVVDNRELALLERNLEIIEQSAKIRGRRFTFELEDGLLKVLKTTER